MTATTQSSAILERLNFFGDAPNDFAIVPSIARYQGMNDIVEGITLTKKTSTYIKGAWNGLLEMLVDILQRQTTEQYVSVTWAKTFVDVATEMYQFAQEVERTHWLALRLNFLALEKKSRRIEHQLRVLRIALAFHTAT